MLISISWNSLVNWINYHQHTIDYFKIFIFLPFYVKTCIEMILVRMNFISQFSSLFDLLKIVQLIVFFKFPYIHNINHRKNKYFNVELIGIFTLSKFHLRYTCDRWYISRQTVIKCAIIQLGLGNQIKVNLSTEPPKVEGNFLRILVFLATYWVLKLIRFTRICEQETLYFVSNTRPYIFF